MTTRILIISTTNSCRSQMAEAFLKSFDHRLEVFSAGIEPRNSVHPLTVKVMGDVGIDISLYVTKDVRQYLDQPFDYVFTLSPEANTKCPAFTGEVKNRWHLAFDNPAVATDTENQALEIFRRVRNEIEEGFMSFYRSQIAGQAGCSCCCGH